MAEMTALVTAVYREYSTSIAPGFENKSPAITSRFELFYDETVPEIAVSRSHSDISRLVTDVEISGTYMHDHIHEGDIARETVSSTSSHTSS
jgi:hypothetical protein